TVPVMSPADICAWGRAVPAAKSIRRRAFEIWIIEGLRTGSCAKGSRKNNLAISTARHQTEDLTNVQFPMRNSQSKWMSDCQLFARCKLRSRSRSGILPSYFCASPKEKPVLCATLLSSELRSRPTPDRMWPAVPGVELQEKANRHR